jgi:uncharacterized protein (TIGR00730 family)
MNDKRKDRIFPPAEEEARRAQMAPRSPQTSSPTYRLAYLDQDFLMRDEIRSVRLQLELLKTELVQKEHGINSTVVIFGSARLSDPETARQRLDESEDAARKDPENKKLQRNKEVARRLHSNCRYYEEARKLGSIISNHSQQSGHSDFVVMTGGGPGIMEAANRGADDVGAKNLGLNIVLPFEQQPNAYITPELAFQFHYFAIRKMHFLMKAKALLFFPGGYGTLDELFEALTLIQTGKILPIPIILFGREYWERIIDFDELVLEGTISPDDLRLFKYVETAEEAWQLIAEIYDIGT